MNSKKVFSVIGSIISWFAVIAQLVLIIQNSKDGIGPTLLRFFSFFTILTNILVALCFTADAFSKKPGGFFTRPAVQTAIAVYITVVGLVYNAILRFIWEPVGLQRIVDEGLHLVVPVLFLLYWMIFVPKRNFSFRLMLNWLIYPFLYLVWVLVRGAFSGEYPYPFMNVGELGYSKVAVNSLLIMILFLFLFFLMIIISRRLARSGQK